MKISSLKAGFSKIGIAIIIVLLAGFIGLVAWSVSNKASNGVDLSKYNFNEYIEGTEDNGNIADHIKGSKDAKVLIFEYADYQCPGCSTTNPRLNKLVEEYDGKLGVVYRNFLLSYHQNGTAAASAAEAAGLQGYWKEYADKLFANQSSWEYASADERTDLFVKMFEKVTDGKGDVEKFKKDMSSKEVAKKIDFDMSIGKAINIPGTPALYLDGQWLDFSNAGTEEKFMNFMREKIDAKLKSLEEK